MPALTKKEQTDFLEEDGILMRIGVSDHPDRGQMGEWLDYEEGNDPWERSKLAMCNMWDEWEGLQEVIKEESSKIE